jgi:hypothetical protein
MKKMKKIILIMAMTLISCIAFSQETNETNQVNLVLDMNFDYNWLEIPSLYTDGTNWTIAVEMSVPRNHIYTNLAANIKVDRMDAIIGPFMIPDGNMRIILGDDYGAVNSIVKLGQYKPTGSIKNKLLNVLSSLLQ